MADEPTVADPVSAVRRPGVEGSGAPRRGVAVWLSVLVGVALGVAGALWLPGWAARGLLVAAVPGLVWLWWCNRRARAAAETLRANVGQFDVLARTLRPTLWVMELPDATLTYVSESFAELTGRDPATMLGRPGAWREVVHPDDRARADASLAHMIEHGHDDTEYRILRTDGTVRWVRELTTAVPSDDGVIRRLAGSVEDVTHRRRAAEQRDILEAELRDANQRFQDFMRASGEAVWRAELGEPVPLTLPYEEFLGQCLAHGWIAECNDAFAQMYGYARPEDAVGTGLLDNFKLENGFNQDYLKRFYAQGCRSLSTESRRPMPDGEVRWVLATFSGVVEDGRLLRLWGTITDITAQRRLEEQVREAHKLEAVGQLAAGVAHDFNNLLAVISAHTDLVEHQAGSDPQVIDSLSVVRETIGHAAGVSRSLMTFSQQLPARRAPVDLTAVIRQTRRMVARSLPARIAMDLELPEESLPTVTGDETQLQQVLLNLVLNARDAMPMSGGRVVIAAEAAGPTSAAGVRLAVQDDGRGMDEDVRRRVFDPFFTTKSDDGGTGLGLAVAHGIVRDHGGQIAVSSRPGRGTTVTIELPAATEAPPTPARNAESAPAKGAEVSPGPAVLLAEDDAQVRAVMASALEARGHRVFPVPDANELQRVYDQCMGRGESIALVITDIEMPGRSGLEVLRQMRAAGDNTPAVVVSGLATAELDPERDGPTVLMNKPFGLSQLCDIVESQLAVRGDEASVFPGA
ncbi:MAG: ATP-binding protein [Planctomycetota bacterium]